MFTTKKQQVACLANNDINQCCKYHLHTSSVVIFFYQDDKTLNKLIDRINQLMVANSYSSLVIIKKLRNNTDPLISSVNKFNQYIDSIKIKYDIGEKAISIVSAYFYSMIITTWIHDYAPMINAVVFISPDLHITNHYQAIKYKLDQFFYHKSFSFNLINKQSQLISKKIINNSSAISLPLLLISFKYQSRKKTVSQSLFFHHLSSIKKEWCSLPRTAFDEQANKILQFIRACDSRSTRLPCLQELDNQRQIPQEYDKLNQPESKWLKKIFWKIRNIALKHPGPLSNNIRFGLFTGVNSGISLAYIYQVKAHGKNRPGKFIDRFYFNNIGWRGTQLYKQHLEALLVLAADNFFNAHQAINIIDIAAGQHRYLLGIPPALPHPVHHILSRDYDDKNIQHSISLAKKIA